jgi:hypothetical protein
MIHLLRSVFALKNRLLPLRIIIITAAVGSILTVGAGCKPAPGLIAPSSNAKCSGRVCFHVREYILYC